MSRGTVALTIAILDIGGYSILSGIALAGAASPMIVLVLGAVAAYSAMGALLVRRIPANRIGALLLAAGTVLAAGSALLAYGAVGVSAAPPWPGAVIVSTLSDVWYTAPFVIALVGVPLVFPDGRLPSRRFRLVAWATASGMVMQARNGLPLLFPDTPDLYALVGAVNVVSVLLLVFGFGGAAVAVWVRFRQGDHVQRQQMKWLLAVAGVAAVAFPLAMVFGASDSWLDVALWLVGLLAYLALPVAIGIAVLRYRLYEIDRIISRTIGYVIVTATLAVVFAGTILLFQTVLEPFTGGKTEAVAASTLVVAALFSPLRRRVQAVVDRRFNRARYDAERTVAEFAARLRREVDLDNLGVEVRGVVSQTVAPATLGLWIRGPESET